MERLQSISSSSKGVGASLMVCCSPDHEKVCAED